MKKIFSLLCLMLITLTMSAQDNPNRLIIQPKQGNIKGYLVERIDSIYFTNLEGRVAADVQFLKYSPSDKGDTLYVAVTKTAECSYYKINVMPTTRANALTSDAVVENYFNQIETHTSYDDFTNAAMTGFEFTFKPNTSYSIVTLGYDKYGIACSASRADFTTPKAEIAGNPDITYTIDELGTTNAKVTITPNSDCASYAWCIFKEGEAQANYEQYAPMWGFENMGEMIKTFCWNLYSGVNTASYTDLVPGTNYELYVQLVDANGNDADLKIITFTTKTMGGTGTAEVNITLGDFVSSGGSYGQYVVYTPNDETNLHRDMLITKEAYNTAKWGDEGVLAYLKQDNSMDPYWDNYGTQNIAWSVDPSTEYIAFAVAQNANGEWGPLTRLAFTTPAAGSASTAAAKHNLPAKRVAAPTFFQKGQAPRFFQKKADRKLTIKNAE